MKRGASFHRERLQQAVHNVHINGGRGDVFDRAEGLRGKDRERGDSQLTAEGCHPFCIARRSLPHLLPHWKASSRTGRKGRGASTLIEAGG